MGCHATSRASAQVIPEPPEVVFQPCPVDGEARSRGGPALQGHNMNLDLPSPCGLSISLLPRPLGAWGLEATLRSRCLSLVGNHFPCLSRSRRLANDPLEYRVGYHLLLVLK